MHGLSLILCVYFSNQILKQPIVNEYVQKIKQKQNHTLRNEVKKKNTVFLIDNKITEARPTMKKGYILHTLRAGTHTLQLVFVFYIFFFLLSFIFLYIFVFVYMTFHLDWQLQEILSASTNLMYEFEMIFFSF